jgi:Flp pilus assembly protein TadD
MQPAWRYLGAKDDDGAYTDVPIYEVIDEITEAPRTALELGCNRGATGAELKSRFPNLHYTGVEVCIEAARVAATRLDRVITEDFLGWNDTIAPESIDLVIATDVLEHLYDPWRTLEKIRPLLTGVARIYATIPNVRNLDLIDKLAAGDWTYSRTGLLDITHIRFFTLRTMLAMFEETGYEVVSVKAFADPTITGCALPEGMRGSISSRNVTIHNVDFDSALELSALKFLLIARPTEKSKCYMKGGDRELSAEVVPAHADVADADFISKLNLAESLRDSGRLLESRALLDSLREIYPASSQVYYKLGVLLSRMGDGNGPEANYRQALSLDSNNSPAHNNLGLILQERGDISIAEHHFREASRLPNPLFEATLNLAILLGRSKRNDEMLELVETACAQRPLAYPELLRIIKVPFQFNFKFFAARLLTSAMQRQPHHFPRRSEEIVQTLIVLGETGYFDGLRILGDIFDLVDRIAASDLTPMLLRTLSWAWSLEENQRLRATQARYDDYLENKTIQAGEKIDILSLIGALDVKELTIGLLGSLRLGNNTAKFLLPLLPHLAKGPHQFVYYSTTALIEGDPVQKELIGSMNTVKSVADLTPFEVARQVAADRCAILIDLDGFSRESKTKALVSRAAPVQISWINWPSTLGLSSADYFMGNQAMLPDDLSLMSETPLLMRTPYGAFAPMLNSEVSPNLPCQTNGYITFGISCAPPKLHERMVRVWSDILAEVSDSRLRVIRHECADDEFCDMLTREFTRWGINPDRLEALDFVSQGLNHLDAYSTIDICLDSAPYGGATTAADCLWMGVPLIALRGPGIHQRLSPAIMEAVGVSELIVATPKDYFTLATELARSVDRLQGYRTNLRAQFQRSALCQPEMVAQEVFRCIGEAVRSKRAQLASSA